MREALKPEFVKEYFVKLTEFVESERAAHQVFPPAEEVFDALNLTPLNELKVLILGQDPYHNDGQAHGLCFSVRRGVKIPPSLRNIYKELESDAGLTSPDHGYLESWARQGILMLNTVLTVRAHQANSHRKKGWENFTDRIIEVVNDLPNVAFVLWGKPAQIKINLIDNRHLIVKSAHPSPLSARNGFFGSKPFSKINRYLAELGKSEIDWQIK